MRSEEMVNFASLEMMAVLFRYSTSTVELSCGPYELISSTFPKAHLPCPRVLGKVISNIDGIIFLSTFHSQNGSYNQILTWRWHTDPDNIIRHNCPFVRPFHLCQHSHILVSHGLCPNSFLRPICTLSDLFWWIRWDCAVMGQSSGIWRAWWNGLVRETWQAGRGRDCWVERHDGRFCWRTHHASMGSPRCINESAIRQ